MTTGQGEGESAHRTSIVEKIVSIDPSLRNGDRRALERLLDVLEQHGMALDDTLGVFVNPRDRMVTEVNDLYLYLDAPEEWVEEYLEYLKAGAAGELPPVGARLTPEELRSRLAQLASRDQYCSSCGRTQGVVLDPLFPPQENPRTGEVLVYLKCSHMIRITPARDELSPGQVVAARAAGGSSAGLESSSPSA